MEIRILKLGELMSLTEYQRDYLSAHSFGYPITTMDLMTAQCANWKCNYDYRDSFHRLTHRIG